MFLISAFLFYPLLSRRATCMHSIFNGFSRRGRKTRSFSIVRACRTCFRYLSAMSITSSFLYCDLVIAASLHHISLIGSTAATVRIFLMQWKCERRMVERFRSRLMESLKAAHTTSFADVHTTLPCCGWNCVLQFSHTHSITHMHAKRWTATYRNSDILIG